VWYRSITLSSAESVLKIHTQMMEMGPQTYRETHLLQMLEYVEKIPWPCTIIVESTYHVTLSDSRTIHHRPSCRPTDRYCSNDYFHDIGSEQVYHIDNDDFISLRRFVFYYVIHTHLVLPCMFWYWLSRSKTTRLATERVKLLL